MKGFEGVRERLLSRVEVDRHGCWNWTGSKNTAGYGNISIGSRTDGSRRTAKAHRISFHSFNGIDPSGFDVCHKCDNPSCINPNHLFLGTEKDNVADMDAKGRRGYVLPEHNHATKLTRGQVIEAIQLRREGASYYSIAKKYGVYRETMRQAIIGKTWRCLDEYRAKPERSEGE